MTTMTTAQIQALYDGFRTPIASVDCGQQCAPYNDGVPFCCDTCHAVPTAYLDEWAYLQDNTELWYLWEAEDPRAPEILRRVYMHWQAQAGKISDDELRHSFLMNVASHRELVNLYNTSSQNGVKDSIKNV